MEHVYVKSLAAEPAAANLFTAACADMQSNGHLTTGSTITLDCSAYVAYDHNQNYVGLAAFRILPSNIMWIDMIYVPTMYQKSLAMAYVAQLIIRHADECKVSQLMANVHPDNLACIKATNKLGAKVVGYTLHLDLPKEFN